MTYDFNTIINRSDKYSIKWNISKHGDSRIPPFSVADTDFKYPPQLIESFKDYVSEMVFGYSIPDDRYYDSFISWMKRRHDTEILKEWIIDMNGVIHGLYHAIETLSNKGAGIMLLTPVYTPFFTSVKNTGREVIEVPLKHEDSHYTIDFKIFEEKAKASSVKVLILCNPHNPVGRVWLKEELIELSRLCEKYDIKIISDEIHMDLVMKNHKHIVFSTVSDYAFNNTITLTSASKTFNIAGAQTSMTIIQNKELRKQYQDVMNQGPLFSLNSFGFKLSEIAYTECEDWLDELLEVIQYNHEYLSEFIHTQIEGVIAYKLEGTYLQWIDFSGLDLDDESLNEFLTQECQLTLSQGLDYGSNASQYMRWNIATPFKELSDGLKRLKNGLENITNYR